MSSLHDGARKRLYLFVDEATQMKIVKHSKYSLICILSAAWIAAGCSAFRWETEAEKKNRKRMSEKFANLFKTFFSRCLFYYTKENFIPIKFPVASNDTFNSENASKRAAGRGEFRNCVVFEMWFWCGN